MASFSPGTAAAASDAGPSLAGLRAAASSCCTVMTSWVRDTVVAVRAAMSFTCTSPRSSSSSARTTRTGCPDSAAVATCFASLGSPGAALVSAEMPARQSSAHAVSRSHAMSRRREGIDATSTAAGARREALPAFASRASMIAKTRSTPMETPTQGTTDPALD